MEYLKKFNKRIESFSFRCVDIEIVSSVLISISVIVLLPFLHRVNQIAKLNGTATPNHS